MAFEFWKYHGLGNDFVLVDAREIEPSWRTEDLARAVCDRNRGVGADGILWLEHSERADYRMIISNSDGSRPEMCGNGIRCMARFVADVEGNDDIGTISTLAGPIIPSMQAGAKQLGPTPVSDPRAIADGS